MRKYGAEFPSGGPNSDSTRKPGDDPRMERLHQIASKNAESGGRNVYGSAQKESNVTSGRWEASKQLRDETKSLIRQQESIIREIKKKSR